MSQLFTLLKSVGRNGPPAFSMRQLRESLGAAPSAASVDLRALTKAQTAAAVRFLQRPQKSISHSALRMAIKGCQTEHRSHLHTCRQLRLQMRDSRLLARAALERARGLAKTDMRAERRKAYFQAVRAAKHVQGLACKLMSACLDDQRALSLLARYYDLAATLRPEDAARGAQARAARLSAQRLARFFAPDKQYMRACAHVARTVVEHTRAQCKAEMSTKQIVSRLARRRKIISSR